MTAIGFSLPCPITGRNTEVRQHRRQAFINGVGFNWGREVMSSHFEKDRPARGIDQNRPSIGINDAMPGAVVFDPEVTSRFAAGSPSLLLRLAWRWLRFRLGLRIRKTAGRESISH